MLTLSEICCAQVADQSLVTRNQPKGFAATLTVHDQITDQTECAGRDISGTFETKLWIGCLSDHPAHHGFEITGLYSGQAIVQHSVINRACVEYIGRRYTVVLRSAQKQTNERRRHCAGDIIIILVHKLFHVSGTFCVRTAPKGRSAET